MENEHELSGPYDGACDQCGSCLVRKLTGRCAWCGHPRRAAKETAVVDAEGVPIRVGDRLEVVGDRNGHCTVESVINAERITVRWDADGSGGLPQYGNLFRHLPAAGEAREAPQNSPGGSAASSELVNRTDSAGDAENASGSEQRRLASEPSGGQLADFTAAVREHLEPRLPVGFRCVTDEVRRIPLGPGAPSIECNGPAFICWVLDEQGREVHRVDRFANQMRTIDVERFVGDAHRIAEKLLSRSARHQPFTEPEKRSFVDAYLAGGKA